MDIVQSEHLPRRISSEQILREDNAVSHIPGYIRGDSTTSSLLNPIGLTQDHHFSEKSTDTPLSGAETSDHQDTKEHFHTTETMDYGPGSSSRSLFHSTIDAVHQALGEWSTQRFENDHTTFRREPKPSVDHDESDGDSLYSPGNTDILFSPIMEDINELLSSPITPTSAELLDPSGKPMSRIDEINRYHRGEYSTGNLIKNFLPERLSPRPCFVSSAQDIANGSEIGLPTVCEADSTADPAEGGDDSQVHASIRAMRTNHTEQGHQDAESWYRSAPVGLTQDGEDRRAEGLFGNRLAAATATKLEDGPPMQGVGMPPNKPLPPLPATQPQEAVHPGSTNKATKPAAIQIPSKSLYNSGYSLVRSAPQYLLSPPMRVLESDVHPALRSSVKSSPFHQELPDSSGYHLSYQPCNRYNPQHQHSSGYHYHYQPCNGYHLQDLPNYSKLISDLKASMGPPISPSLPASRFPSTYLQPSPKLSRRPSSPAVELSSPSASVYSSTQGAPSVNAPEEVFSADKESSATPRVPSNTPITPSFGVHGPASLTSLRGKPISSASAGPYPPATPSRVRSRIPVATHRGSSANSTPLSRGFGISQEELGPVDEEVAHDPFTEPHLVPTYADANEVGRRRHNRSATTFTTSSHAFGALTARSSSLALRTTHDEGVRQFNRAYLGMRSPTNPNYVIAGPSDTDYLYVGPPVVLPQPSKGYNYDRGMIHYPGGSEQKVKAVMGQEAVIGEASGSSVGARRARVNNDHARMVGDLTGGKILFKRSSWELKKAVKAGKEEVKKFFGGGNPRYG